ncbi:50S ribosomal protein L14 [Clostridium saccharobutylicum DSM 13864]|uniref:50S ribosomal protein L14 n=1 Tax=Clostridium saccharobutylicum DSM 13864 TaxID=1345695 RepID=U5ML53_CLOSA|nr:50S ribosomal protein L14 [Clostridium saccharobutylicum DSM 13864]
MIITAAFSSNLIYEPSALLTPLTDLTTTAFTTSPFLTTPPGVALLTLATITSPMLPNFLLDPPKTLIHIISFAPELSATFNKVCCCIIELPSFQL